MGIGLSASTFTIKKVKGGKLKKGKARSHSVWMGSSLRTGVLGVRGNFKCDEGPWLAAGTTGDPYRWPYRQLQADMGTGEYISNDE